MRCVKKRIITSKIPFSQKYISILLDLSGVILALTALIFDLIRDHFSSDKPGIVQLFLVGVGLILTMVSSLLARSRPFRQVIFAEKLPSFIVFGISAVLMSMNLLGFIIPFRNPGVYEITHQAGKDRAVIVSPQEVFQQMNRIEAIDEQYPDYAIRLTQLIYDGTVHHWVNDPENTFNLRIPIQENFVIYLENKIKGNAQPYEFCRAERAIERGASVCSQSAKILADILIRNRVRANIVGLEGHVVVQARVSKEPEEWWILDPDYGVVVKHGLDDITNDLQIIREAYSAQGYNDNTIDKLVQIYGSEDNQIIDKRLRCEKENQLYFLKWSLPISGMLPLLSFLGIKIYNEVLPKWIPAKNMSE